MHDSLLVYTDRATVVISLVDGDIVLVMLEQRGVVLEVDTSLELATAITVAVEAQIAASLSAANAETSASDAANSAAEAASASGGILPVGGWDASVGTNPPTPDPGVYPWYRITVDGNIPAVGDVHVGDNVYWDAVHNDWFKIDNTDRFTSINGYTSGEIELTADDVGAPSVDRVKDIDGSLILAAGIVSGNRQFLLITNQAYDFLEGDITFAAVPNDGDGEGSYTNFIVAPTISNAPPPSNFGYEVKIRNEETFDSLPVGSLLPGQLYTFKLRYLDSEDEEVPGEYFFEVIDGIGGAGGTVSYIDEYPASLGLDQSLSIGLEQLLNLNYNSIQTINSGGVEGTGTAIPPLYLNPLGAQVLIGQQGEGPHNDNTVVLFSNGSQAARTLNPSLGGFEVNNTSTGSGFERVLTTSDISGIATTPEDILDALLLVDGPGSELDADTVDGFNASDFLRKTKQTESFFGSSFSCHSGNEGVARLTASPASPYNGPSLDFILNNTSATIKRFGWEDNGNDVGVPEGLTGVSLKQPNNVDNVWLAVEGNIYSNTELVLTESEKGSQVEIDAGTGDELVTAFTLANYSGLAAGPITISSVTGLQTELDSKAPQSHLHTIANVTGLQLALDDKSNTGHLHVIANVSGLQLALDAKADISHTNTIANITGLQTALDGKAATSHGHTLANITGLQTALDGKAATSHTHTIANVTGLQSLLDSGVHEGDSPGFESVTINGSLLLPNTTDATDIGRVYSSNLTNRDFLVIQPGASAISGGVILLYGENDSSEANKIFFKSQNSIELEVREDGVFVFDESSYKRKVAWKPRLITLGTNTTFSNSHIHHTVYVQTASTITIPDDIGEVGDIIQVLTNTNAITIAEGTGVFLEWQQGGTFSSGDRVLDQKSVATLICLGSAVWKLWGIGIS